MRLLINRSSLCALVLTACGIFGPHECTLIGCVNGLIVHLNAMPTGPWRVEVFDASPGQSPVHVYDCPTGQCRQDVSFPNYMPQRAWVRVTTETGVETTEFPGIEYEVNQPNGPDCGPTCRQSTVMMDLPAGSA